MPLVLVSIGQFCHDVIGCQNVKVNVNTQINAITSIPHMYVCQNLKPQVIYRNLLTVKGTWVHPLAPPTSASAPGSETPAE